MRGDALGRKRLLPKSDDKKLALRPLVNRSSLAQARWTKLRRCSRGGLCCLCSCLFLLVFFDLGVVLNNLLIDLDNLVSPPGAPSARPEEDRGARRVREYMERQWAQASKRRESFLLWDYFDLKAHEELGHRKAPGTWSDLIIARMALWAKRLKYAGDNRFVIEKDKCAMFRMLRQLRLPHPRVRLEWRAADYGDGGRLRSYLLGEADAKDPGLERCAYPAILKVGHIHQQKSTIFLPSEADARGRVDDYVRWTTDRMREKFVDRASWAAQSNPLYASIDACLIVQDVVNPGDFGGEARAARPLELMVEVFWGRAVQAVLTVDAEGELVLGKPQYKNTAEFVVLRDGWAAYKWPYLARDGKFFSRRYTNPRSHVRAHRKARESWFRYDTDPAVDDGAADADDACEGVRATERATCLAEYADVRRMFRAKYGDASNSFPEVWRVCDALATGVGADYVRCDVFVAPDGSVAVNEISLSSNWGNAVSDAWQRELVKLWTRGYDGADACTPHLGSRCGAAFAGVYEGDLPSPKYVFKP